MTRSSKIKEMTEVIPMIKTPWFSFEPILFPQPGIFPWLMIIGGIGVNFFITKEIWKKVKKKEKLNYAEVVVDIAVFLWNCWAIFVNLFPVFFKFSLRPLPPKVISIFSLPLLD